MKVINISVVGALGRMGKLLVKQITKEAEASPGFFRDFLESWPERIQAIF